ncbi:hypothetical protein BH11BAC2_BH11BAC2_14420 [soil metagenome]
MVYFRTVMIDLRSWYLKAPLKVIVLGGLLLRLIAAFFSRGYGMHDDHFLVIEAGSSFADGFDYNNWLPWNSGGVPSGHSWFYVGIHFLIFKFYNLIGLHDPQWKMIIIRVLHAVYSLLVIVLGYKITIRLSDEKTARYTACLLAFMWFIPATSVRNLVEWVCVPPLMASVLYLLKFEESRKRQFIILAGVFAGIAMGIRFQSLFFFAGTGIYLLWKREIINGIICFISFLIAFFLTQSVDLLIWGHPFVEMGEYIRYNLANSTTYFDRPWYQYILTVGGMLVPPVSLFLIAGYVKSWKKILPLLLPSMAFFLFHSYFPNKQERFILPFVPFLIMGGMIGWMQMREHITWKKFESGSWKFFWVLNFLAMAVISTNYTKRPRVEAMYYLYGKPDYNAFVVESTQLENPQSPPQFYSGKWQKPYCLYKDYTVTKFNKEIKTRPASDFPNYILFFDNENLKNRVDSFQIITGKKLELVYTAQPSNLDELLHWLNSHNKNYPMYVYHTK